MGGDHPVRIQTMTNTNTLDTKATVQQIIDIANAGADYVRMTVRSPKEAENLAEIKNSLRQQGFQIPLVADVHFNPKVAEIAAGIVEKVRINPGNFTDFTNSQKAKYSENQYVKDLQKLRERFVSLINICREHGTALRIGVNHGSLSNRIVSKYGDTPAGMVESAMEFLRICAEEDFHQVVVSLKSSNTRLMVLANQLMVYEMDRKNLNYPLHLGVTEAGNEEDGRIKSAAGIGLLLAQGIGDTIRVSLTEDSVKEIPVAQKIVNYYSGNIVQENVNIPSFLKNKSFEFSKRKSKQVLCIGGKQVPVVVSDQSACVENKLVQFQQAGLSPEFIYTGARKFQTSVPENVFIIQDYDTWSSGNNDDNRSFPLFSHGEFELSKTKSPLLNFVSVSSSSLTTELVKKINSEPTMVLVLDAEKKTGYTGQRIAFEILAQFNCLAPVVIRRNYDDKDAELIMIKAAADIGGLFIEGYGDGIWLQAGGVMKTETVNDVSFSVLQASRARTSKTEFISCPSCGRTLFNLEEVTNQIKKKTGHLKGLKIAVMGCFVNGPGEMADADYGYIGSGKNRVNLYKGRQIIKKDIPEEKAIGELIELLKASGDWMDPE